MQQNYSKKIDPIQKATKNTASSVLDASSQSEALQRKADMANNAAQREEAPRPNNTGMPDNLKSGIESLSGFSMNDVRVHYNSSKPATVQALAYTQGTDIHVAPGQEKHLPHEAWHVAQQMAGRVSPTTNINGMPVNDNAALEHEADVMGEKAVQCKMFGVNFTNGKAQSAAVQRMAFYNPNSPSETTQIEGDAETAALFNRKVGDERNSELARYVDQFKKEMLTYIACCIQEKGNKNKKPVDYGPHISVVITGGKWYIAINSDYVMVVNKLLTDAKSVQLDISKKWEEIHKWFNNGETKKKHPSMFLPNPSNEFAKKQALYIVYRWAGKNKDVVAGQNQARNKGEGVVHGEMETLDFLEKNETEWKLNFFIRYFSNNGIELTTLKMDDLKKKLNENDDAAIDYLNSLLSVGEEKINKDTIKKCMKNELKNRVIRVGGTKTACLDCHYEMGGKCEHVDGALIKENGEEKELVLGDCLKQNCDVEGNNPKLDSLSGKPIMLDDYVHADAPSKKVIKERTVVTMTPEHGMGYKGWRHPNSTDLKERKTGYHNCDLGEYEEQTQDYDELFITAESVLSKENKMSISESIISLWEKRVDDLEILNRHDPEKKLETLKNLKTENEQECLKSLIQSFEDLKKMKNEYIDAFVCYLGKLVNETSCDDVKKDLSNLDDVKKGLSNLFGYEIKLLLKLRSDVEKQKKSAMVCFERSKNLEKTNKVCFVYYRSINSIMGDVKRILSVFVQRMKDFPNKIPPIPCPEERKTDTDFCKVFFPKAKKLNSFLGLNGRICQAVAEIKCDLKPSNMNELNKRLRRKDFEEFTDAIDFCYPLCNDLNAQTKEILKSAKNVCRSLAVLYHDIERDKEHVSVLLNGLKNENDDLLLRITMLMDKMRGV